MSLNKWLDEDNSKNNKAKSKTKIISPFKEQKLKKIKESIKKSQKQESELKDPINAFLSYVLEFKEFLNSRTYLRGDLDNLITWITNLNYKYKELINSNENLDTNDKKSNIELLKEIPPTFFDEKLTLTLKKYAYIDKLNNSDRYYLRKLKSLVKDQLKRARIYQIVDKILNQ